MPQTFPVPAVPGFQARLRLGRVAPLVGLALRLNLASGGQTATTWTVRQRL